MADPLDDVMRRELENLKDVVRPETDWRRGLSAHPWVVVVIVSLGSALIGSLSSRVTSVEAREHQELREDQRKLASQIFDVRADVNMLQANFPRLAANTQEALNGIKDLQREQYSHYRAEALRRGDEDAARRLKLKLDALKRDQP